MKINACFVACVLLTTSAMHAADWPQFLGPTRNGVAPGKTAIIDALPAGGPKVLWQKDVGEGYASPVISGDKLILFHRVKDAEKIDCLDAATGETIWSTSYPTDYLDDMRKGNGPRSTPGIADGRIFTFGPDGVLQCTDLATGKAMWQVDTRKQFRSPKGFFGRACSPLVVDGLVLLNIGGADAGIGAFDAKTGELKWKATQDEAGYASPVAATIGETSYAFFFTRTGLVAADPKGGEVHFQHRWRSRQHASVNGTSPLVVGNIVFLTSSYETGATALAVTGGKYETLWAADDVLSSQYANVVHKDGYLYGFDGRNDFGDTKLRCVELKTGKVAWTKDELPAGPIILADGKLVILLESGELLLASATRDGYRQLGRAKVLSNPVRANAALVDGLLYARDDAKLVCVDLRKK